MPPKKPDPKKAAQPEPQAAPPDPVVLAAMQLVDMWKGRMDEIKQKKDVISGQLKELNDRKSKGESGIKDLTTQVQELVAPKPAKPAEPESPQTKPKATTAKPPPKSKAEVAAAEAATAAAAVPVAPPKTPREEEEAKKAAARQAQQLINAFKKPVKTKVTKTIENPNGVQEQVTTVEETVLHKPPDIAEDLWANVLALREKRLGYEDTLQTVRHNIDTVGSRRSVVTELERVAQYSYDGAIFQLKKAKEKAEERLLHPPPAGTGPAGAPGGAVPSVGAGGALAVPPGQHLETSVMKPGTAVESSGGTAGVSARR